MKVHKKAWQPIVFEPDDRPIITRYRPQRLEEFIGNASAVNKVKTILDDPIGKSRAFLISGPVGCGKTTLARIMSQALTGGDDWDIHEINCAGRGGVDDMREVLNIMRSGSFAKCPRIIFFDEAALELLADREFSSVSGIMKKAAEKFLVENGVDWRADKDRKGGKR